MEMAVVANATGLRAGKRGMYGPEVDHVDNCVDLFPKEDLLGGGIVDYVIGGSRGRGFRHWAQRQPLRSPYMNYFKLGRDRFMSFTFPTTCRIESFP